MADSFPPIVAVLCFLALLWGGFMNAKRYYYDGIKTRTSEERAARDRAKARKAEKPD